MPKIPGGVLGSYNGVVLRFYMEREESFYLIKVLSIILMLTAVSWTTMMVYESKKMVSLNGTLTGATRRVVSVASFTERINLSCAVLLACVAFQYLISENLPKTGYMTTMDKLLMCSFVTIFMGALETVVCRLFSSYDRHDVAEAVDAWSVWIIPAIYVTVSFGYVVEAVVHRRGDRLDASRPSSIGVHDSLMLITHAAEVAKVASEQGWREAHSESATHLVEETIDDVNVVDEFMKETEEIVPGVVVGGKHHHTSSRSLFGNGV
jgi:hypothetical protein